MKPDRGSTFVEGAGVGADDSLAEIGGLQLLVLEIMLDELRHRPVEQQRAGFLVVAQAFFNLLASRRIADPDIALIGRTKSIARPAYHRAHGPKAFQIARRETLDLGVALRVVVPELNASPIEKGHEQAIGRRSPGESARRQAELFDDQRMQESGEVGAGRHLYAGEGFFDRARAADSFAGFK